VAEPVALSARNQKLVTLRRLSGRRSARLEAGAFVIEGPVVVDEAQRAGVTLDELYVDAEALTAAPPGAALRRAVDAALAVGTPVWSVGPGVLARAADTSTPQGLLAVASRRTAAVEAFAPVGAPGPVLVLVDLADPGNAGTLLRSAEAAGAAGVVVAGSTTDPFGPKAVRAAAGSVLRLPVAEVPGGVDAVEALRRQGRTTVATVARGGAAPEDVDLTGPVVVVVGSEAHGLDPAVVAVCDRRVTVPLAPGVESLNAGVAGSLVLFEAARQRRGPHGARARSTEPGSPAGTDWTPAGSPDRLGDR
jgi:TrmH family RNA methyltransferase